jgi:hypothetical protein
MDKKNRLIIMEIVLILILLITCSIIQSRTINFKRDCKVTYDLNSSCPCNSHKLYNYPFNPLNLTIADIPVSIKK